MANQVQEGFLYEKNAWQALKSFGVVGRPPAGASHDRPDLELKVGRIIAGVELKNQPTTAGSLVMQYIGGEWKFGPTDDNPEKEFMKGIGVRAKTLDRMNDEWKKPVLQYTRDGKKTYIGVDDSRKAYNMDIAKFGARGAGDIYQTVPNRLISGYYNNKKTHYMNVGTHGLFLLNDIDPFDLNTKLRKARLQPIPDFSSPRSAETKIRVRCQYKGSGSYQFTFTLQFGKVMKSPYNIAPIRAGSNSSIDMMRLKKDSILAIL